MLAVGDFEQFRDSDINLSETYSDEKAEHEDSLSSFREAVTFGIIHYSLLSLLNVVAVIVTDKSEKYYAWVPLLVTLIQLCELPFLPCFPTWYITIIVVWQACSLFFIIGVSV